mgnify:FL=1
MNEDLTVVLKLHRKFVGKGLTIGYISVGECYLCETVERTPYSLPPGMYTIIPSGGDWYSMQWDIIDGVPDWFKQSCNDKPKIRTRSNDYITYNVEQAKPEKEGIIDLGYMYGVLSGGKWWRKGFDDIMRSFIRLTPKKITASTQFKLQIL